MKVGTRIGGKGLVFRQLINLMPPHDAYIEPFLGGGSVMLHKKQATVNIGVDLDEEVIQAWRRHLKAAGTAVSDGGAVPPIMTVTAASTTPPITAGLPSGTHLFHADALTILEALPVTEKTLIYADPPYLMETRRFRKGYYKHELGTHDKHHDLITLLKRFNCMIMISHYPCTLYESMLADWHMETFTTYDRANNQRVECVWMNYDLPMALHDYSFLGCDYRERERIKKKKKRWITKLRGMERLERQALLAAIEEAGFYV